MMAKTRLTRTNLSSSIANGVLYATPTLAARKADDHRKMKISGRTIRNSMMSGRTRYLFDQMFGNADAETVVHGGGPVDRVQIG